MRGWRRSFGREAVRHAAAPQEAVHAPEKQ
jgi:hypothetical protein